MYVLVTPFGIYMVAVKTNVCQLFHNSPVIEVITRLGRFYALRKTLELNIVVLLKP